MTDTAAPSQGPGDANQHSPASHRPVPGPQPMYGFSLRRINIVVCLCLAIFIYLYFVDVFLIVSVQLPHPIGQRRKADSTAAKVCHLAFRATARGQAAVERGSWRRHSTQDHFTQPLGADICASFTTASVRAVSLAACHTRSQIVPWLSYSVPGVTNLGLLTFCTCMGIYNYLFCVLIDAGRWVTHTHTHTHTVSACLSHSFCTFVRNTVLAYAPLWSLVCARLWGVYAAVLCCVLQGAPGLAA